VKVGTTPERLGLPLTALSIVMPVYNEAGVIEEIVLGIEREVLPLVGGRAELIVIDDRSTDATPAILDRLAADRAWLRVDRASRNAGHGPSVVRGLEHATGAWIFQLDSDGQFVLAEFSDLWRCRRQADLVMGVRVERRDPAHRRLLSRVIRVVVSLLAGRRLGDPNVPFRLFRREVWIDLRPFLPQGALAPSILLATGAVLRGWRVVDVPVTHLPRLRGVSSLRAWRLVRFSLRGLGQLLAFRYRLGRPARAPRRATERTA
jgi:dolichol-phosphate mannosyltransferase